MKLNLKNPNTGIVKAAPVGFSWTTFFFGGFPALFRGDFKWFLIQFLVACVTMGFSNLVFAFIYNKLFITGLLERGYKVKSVDGTTVEYLNTKLGLELPLLAEVR
jgi:hypothetical protein